MKLSHFLLKFLGPQTCVPYVSSICEKYLVFTRRLVFKVFLRIWSKELFQNCSDSINMEEHNSLRTTQTELKMETGNSPPEDIAQKSINGIQMSLWALC